MKKVWIVVAAWVWWTAVAGAAWASPLMVEDQHTLRYKVVSFTLADLTKNKYTKFLEDLRGQLGTQDERHGIPVMRDPSTVSPSERYLLVELTNSAERSVTLAIDVTNAYVVAYAAGTQSYYLNEVPAPPDDLFPGTERSTLAFSGSYTSLQQAAGRSREEIDLGFTELGAAITSLFYSESGTQIARGLIVIIQMVSEAARFKYIERRGRQSVEGGVYQSFLPDALMLSLENNWGALSSAIQQSNEGVFSSPVQLQRADYTTQNVDRVTAQLIANLAFMVFVCRGSAPQFAPLIRSVVAVDGDETCVIPEPTVRISGRNGLCVDVRDGQYNNGNPIQLWPCKSNEHPKQLSLQENYLLETLI